MFNYSNKCLYNYKNAFGINKIAMHGEGDDANLDSLAIPRRYLPVLQNMLYPAPFCTKGIQVVPM